jgi:hypothetical protein
MWGFKALRQVNHFADASPAEVTEKQTARV